jgi:hypothetical protein
LSSSRTLKRGHIVAPGEEIAMMRRFLHWFFRNGETGAVTITQAPNLVLWIVIVAGFSGSGLRQAIRVLL